MFRAHVVGTRGSPLCHSRAHRSLLLLTLFHNDIGRSPKGTGEKGCDSDDEVSAWEWRGLACGVGGHNCFTLFFCRFHRHQGDATGDFEKCLRFIFYGGPLWHQGRGAALPLSPRVLSLLSSAAPGLMAALSPIPPCPRSPPLVLPASSSDVSLPLSRYKHINISLVKGG